MEVSTVIFLYFAPDGICNSFAMKNMCLNEILHPYLLYNFLHIFIHMTILV